MTLPSQETLQEWLDYDPASGVFRWKKEPRPYRPLIGKEAGYHRPEDGYILIKIQGSRLIRAHRLAWIFVHGTLPEDASIDHIDGNPSNNAIENLRLATPRQQNHNQRVRRDNRSGLKGAHFSASNKKWCSQITAPGQRIHLGYFGTAEEAHEAYVKAAKLHFGEFARDA